MDTNVNYTLVGAFVLVIISAIVVAIVWLSSGLRLTTYSSYLIYSQESVSGLNIDASVEYNGVNVGAVKDISIDPNNPHVVKLLINVNSSTPITRGTVATLTSRGVTGVVFVALKDAGSDMRPIHPAPGDAYPVIPTTPSLFMRLDIALTRLTNNLDSISNAFRTLLDKQNLESISQSLENIEHITSSVSAESAKLATLISNTSKASQQLEPLLQHGMNIAKSLDTQTLPTVYQMTNSMNHLMQTLNDVSLQLKQNPSIIVRGSAPLPLGPGERR